MLHFHLPRQPHDGQGKCCSLIQEMGITVIFYFCKRTLKVQLALGVGRIFDRLTHTTVKQIINHLDPTGKLAFSAIQLN